MALRLRRGTDAERLLITPLQGELIYTIDTKQLYAGDGTTAGGTLVSAAAATTLESLTDTDLAGKANGQVLSWNSGTNKWEPTTIASGVGDGVVEGSNYQINIISDDSTVLVNSDTNTFTGNLTGDVLGNLTGDVLGNLTGNVNGNIIGNLTGNVTGNIDGDVKGSIFAEDSSVMVDAISNSIKANTDNIFVTSKNVVAGTLALSGIDSFGAKAGIKITTDGNADDLYSLFDIVGATESEVGSAINFSRSRGTLASPTVLQDEDEILGINYFGYDSNNTPQVAAVIQARVDGTPGSGSVPGTLALLTADSNGDINLGITLGADSATRFWGPAKLVEYADTTARDAAIPTPANGMMIYLTATHKAQVYANTGWVDLH